MLQFDELFFPEMLEPMSDPDVLSIQRDYPMIYLACHVDHVRAPRSRFHLSPRESGILAHLDPGEPTGPTELAAHLRVSPSALSASLAKLVRQGYVERRTRARDRRHADLFITPLGVEALQAGSVLDSARLGALLAQMSPSDRRQACRGLSLLARAARQLAEPRRVQK
ncbi:MAG: winged helix-turn-helix transcriptional regulator [Planctomycetes bacterium]|nr:winged helix-turn-helix transcriptional regulator [Planctomycetota bacterium]